MLKIFQVYSLRDRLVVHYRMYSKEEEENPKVVPYLTLTFEPLPANILQDSVC